MVVPTESAIARHLHARKSQIADVWQQLVRAELPELQGLDTASLLDHLPEFIEGLARWIDGDTAAARGAFATLAEGHALQRLGYGIDLVTLTREYMLLRTTIMRELMSVGSSEATRELMLRMNEGMDEAIHEAVRRYTNRRAEIRDRFVGQLMTEAVELAALPDGMPIVLRHANMGALWQQAIDEARRAHPQRAIALSRTGDLDGVWDHDRVLQAASTLLANVIDQGADPIAVFAREADDRQAVITSVTYRGAEVPVAQLYTMREIVLSHAAYWDVETRDGATTFTIVWPRTPFDEGPPRT